MMNGGTPVNKSVGSGQIRQSWEMILRPLIQSPARSSIIVFFFVSFIVAAFLSTRFLDSSKFIALEIRNELRSSSQLVCAYAKTISDAKTMPYNLMQNGVVFVVSNGVVSVVSKRCRMLCQNGVCIPIEVLKNFLLSCCCLQSMIESSTQQTSFAVSTSTQLTSLDKAAQQTDSTSTTTETPKKAHRKVEFPLHCYGGNINQTCPADYPEKLELDPDAPPSSTCPEYFRWIYEDLRPWQKDGIIREMVEGAKKTANFRLVIKNGKAYVERYQKSWQTRDVFTLWGFLQLLRKYPGRVPDLELMFDCVDWPVISKRFQWPNNMAPPPLFRYCGDDRTWDIVFPDWSFWGWAEINIKPWEFLSKDLKEGNKKVKFVDREPYAYWKGNPFVAEHRIDLLKCNASEDWHARVYVQDWAKEAQQGFKKSDLANQCLHRYKIYIEGSAWSVSEKYILACDSVALLINPLYYDFFSRSLMPRKHYWPVKQSDKCRSIKFAAQAIGKAASDFILKDLTMDYVYDYMLHLLTEYAKLLKFEPTIPENAVELCSETMACPAEGLEKKFMMDSLVKGPSDKAPCAMPPPYDRAAFQALLRRKTSAVKQVEKLERDYWRNRTRDQ
ncbi:Protein O-glucosyltransferase 1 [Bienertia sinuspersici]